MKRLLIALLLLSNPLFALDQVAPTVSSVTPVEGTEVKDEISFQAQAEDDLRLDQVQLLLDGSVYGNAEKEFPYLWKIDTKTLSEGKHSFQFKAQDACGNETTTAASTIIVKNVVPPPPPPPPLPPPSNLTEDVSCQGLSLESFPQDAAGWTVYSVPSRVILVSASNAGKPLNPDPNTFQVTTLAQAQSYLRKGQNDALLFNRGETFNLTAPLDASKLGGISTSSPMVIGAYGSGARPILKYSSDQGLLNTNGSLSNLLFLSLDLQANRATGKNPYGFRYVASGGKNILIEDVRVQNFGTGIAFDVQGSFQNLQMRRSEVLDTYTVNNGGNAEGVYIDKVAGLLIEESLFDHNGYLNRSSATIFNHNLYLQTFNTCMSFKKNVTMRASATGLQMRAGGVVEDNLFIENPLHLTYGLVNGGSVDSLHVFPGVSGRVMRNVMLNATDINPNNLRSGVSEVSNIWKAQVSENIIAHHLRGGPNVGQGFDFKGTMGIGVHNIKIEKNILYDLKDKILFEGAAWGTVQLQVDGLGAAVFSGTTKFYGANISGISKSFAPRFLLDSGSLLSGNLMQTGANDFVNITSAPKPGFTLLNMQKAPVKFKDPSRVPAMADLLKLREMHKMSWDIKRMAPAMNAWVRDGFQVIP